MASDFIQWKNGNAYFRRKVPKELQQALGRREWSQALKTGDKFVARERARALEVQSNREIEGAWRRLRGKPLDPAEIGELAALEFERERQSGRLALWRAKQVEDWAPGQARSGAIGQSLQDLGAQLDEATTDVLDEEELRSAQLASLVASRRKGDLRLVEPFADEFFRGKGLAHEVDGVLTIDRKRDDYQALCRELLDQQILAIKQGLLDVQRAKLGLGEEAPRQVLVPVAAPQAVELLRDEASQAPLQLFERFARDSAGKRGSSMLTTVRAALGLLAEVTGDKGVAQITERDIALFHDLVSACPAKHKARLKTATMQEAIDANRLRVPPLPCNTRPTVAKHISALKTFFKWAVSRRFALGNPANGLSTEGGHASANQRDSFTAEEIGKLFALPLFQTPAGQRDHRFWVPYLALYTGGRLAELCQLAVADVKEQGDTAWIEITNRGEGQSVKSAAGRRIVPLHGDLLALGFLDYWKAQKAAGSARLFPKAPRGAEGRNPYNPVSQWFTRLLDQSGLRRPGLSFHSFRHTWNEAARQSSIPREMRECLMGHSNGTVNDDYGGTFGLEARARAMAALQLTVRQQSAKMT